jgi:L-threonylcarbamoyladenylate synthase
MIVVEMPLDPTAYSAQIYATLHELDHAGMDRILVDWPPETDDWLAVRDRLRRAAAR